MVCKSGKSADFYKTNTTFQQLEGGRIGYNKNKKALQPLIFGCLCKYDVNIWRHIWAFTPPIASQCHRHHWRVWLSVSAVLLQGTEAGIKSHKNCLMLAMVNTHLSHQNLCSLLLVDDPHLITTDWICSQGNMGAGQVFQIFLEHLFYSKTWKIPLTQTWSFIA